MITDGANLVVLFRRQEACYRTQRDGVKVGPFPSFIDFIKSESAYANAKDRAWWDSRSTQAHRGSRFYAGKPASPGPRHTRVAVSLGAERTERLRAVSGSKGFRGLTPDLSLCNVFAVALVAWYWRIENEDSVCVGVTTHGRITPSQKETAGLFMQQLPFHVDVAPDDDFLSLAGRVARHLFELMSRATPGCTSARAQKCFDVTLNYIPASFGSFDGLRTEMVWRHNGYGDPGSTGEPKGVQVSHRNLVHSTTARDHHYDRWPSRFLLLSSFAFDSSLVGIFWTLCRGGTLVLPEPGAERDIGRVGGMIERHAVTHVLCLPSLYRILLDHEWASLATVIVAGEACGPDLVERHFDRLPGTQLHNEYGPTEGTIWITVHRLSPEDAHGSVAIGRPIVNTRAIVLDPVGEPVPDGVAGELYIGGEGISRGYVNSPAQTSKAFVPDTFGDDMGSRLYRTGDLARVRGDGNLEFLGRVDRQIKVRGYRIELEEIERSLEGLPEIEAAAADVRATAPRLDGGDLGAAEDASEVDRLLARLMAMDAHSARALIDEIEALSEGDLSAAASGEYR